MARALTLALSSALLVSAQVPNVALQAFRALTDERLDPVISPGVVGSQHVHRVVGGSAFAPTYDPEALRQASCSNLDVQADKSNYWAPIIYYQHLNGSYSALGGETRIYYETLLPVGDGSTTVQTQPFPHSFQMVTGNPAFKGPISNTDFSTQANFYFCATTPDGTQGVQYWGFPTQWCYFISSKSFFPSCWNGNPYDVNNPTAHMAFPLDNIGVGGNQVCPPGYNIRLPLILMENVYYSLGQYANEGYNGPGTYTLANGDITGFGLHADFQNGWDDATLQAFVTTPSCQRPQVAAPANVACSVLAPSYNRQAAENCRLQAPNTIVNEIVGADRLIAALPGCNKVWASGSKPTCRGLLGAQMTTPKGFGGWDNVPLPYYVGLQRANPS